MRLVLAFSLAFASCFLAAPAEAADAATLRLATFECDATPPVGSWLYTEPLKTIEHPLLAKGIVLDDGSHRYVLAAIDWCVLAGSTHLPLRKQLAEAAGTDVGRVMVQCVHQHTAPVFDGDGWQEARRKKDPPDASDPGFITETGNRLGKAIREALGKLVPVDRIGTGQAKVDRVASSRRLPLPDGKVRTRFSAATDPELQAAPEGLIDPLLKTITFAQGERPIVRLHYYATHPQSYYRDGRASYDFVGMARQRLQEKEGVFQIYFTGCAGDVAAGKYNNGTPEARAALADRLFAGMEASVASTRYVPIQPIAWRNVELVLSPKVARPDGKPMPPIQLGSLAIGSIHIVHLPGEPMLEYQLYAQKQLPNDFVAVAGYGEGSPGYICTERAFTEGGYEPTGSEAAPNSEPLVKTAIRGLLGVE
jgi:hypothetical protein